nr:CDGSH iron-sulfur domain-containing protein [Kineococcus aurantiacus]
MVEGPLEVVLPDGRRVVSERPVTAVCACRRSQIFPWCDTSHRRRRRPAPSPSPSSSPASSPEETP